MSFFKAVWYGMGFAVGMMLMNGLAQLVLSIMAHMLIPQNGGPGI